jgi:hypothetical protein
MKQDVYPEINLSQKIIDSLNETYKQGDIVYFDNGSVSGFGTICGQSSNPVVFVGATYIIEPDVSFDTKVYDFTHFAIQQLYLKKNLKNSCLFKK